MTLALPWGVARKDEELVLSRQTGRAEGGPHEGLVCTCRDHVQRTCRLSLRGSLGPKGSNVSCFPTGAMLSPASAALEKRPYADAVVSVKGRVGATRSWGDVERSVETRQLQVVSGKLSAAQRFVFALFHGPLRSCVTSGMGS